MQTREEAAENKEEKDKGNGRKGGEKGKERKTRPFSLLLLPSG